MTLRCIRVVFAVAALAAARGAAAQSIDLPSGRPTETLFGSGPAGASQQLDVTLSVLGAYDTSLGDAISGGVADEPAQVRGSFGGLGGGLNYSKKLRHGAFRLSENSSARYYTGHSELFGAQHSAGAGLDLSFDRTRLTLSQTVGYLPFYAFTLLPALFTSEAGEVPVPADHVITRRDQRVSSSLATMQHSFSERTTLEVRTAFDIADFFHESTGVDSKMAAARVSTRIAKGVSLVAGYGLIDSTYRVAGDGTRFRNHDITLGLNIDRPLSVSRRTTISLATGSTAVEDASNAVQYYVTADGRMNHQFGRSWHLTAGYRRAVEAIQGFQRPFFADGVNVDVGGMISRRADLLFGSGVSSGQLTGFGPKTHTDSLSGSARLRISLSRHAALTISYLSYQYRFDQSLDLPVGLPLHLDRQALRVGIDLWCPLVRD